MSYTKERLVEQYESEDLSYEEGSTWTNGTFEKWEKQFFDKMRTPFQKMGFYGKAK